MVIWQFSILSLLFPVYHYVMSLNPAATRNDPRARLVPMLIRLFLKTQKQAISKYACLAAVGLLSYQIVQENQQPA